MHVPGRPHMRPACSLRPRCPLPRDHIEAREERFGPKCVLGVTQTGHQTRNMRHVMASDIVSVLPHQHKGAHALAFQGVGEAYAAGPITHLGPKRSWMGAEGRDHPLTAREERESAAGRGVQSPAGMPPLHPVRGWRHPFRLLGHLEPDRCHRRSFHYRCCCCLTDPCLR